MLLTAVISAIATAPRIVRPNAEDFSYLASHYCYLFVLVFVFWLASPFFVNGKYLLIKVLAFLVLGGLFSVFYHRISEHFFSRFSAIYADFPFMDNLPLRRRRLLLFFRGVAFAAVLFFIEYYFRMLFEKQKTSLEVEQLKQERLEAQLRSLSEQISPHFLFNSLSILQTMLPDDASRNYIVQLSNVYRYLLAFHDNQLATLGEELAFMRSYVYILQERFEDAFQVKMDIDDALLLKKIPPLTLQLLVENAVKHNVVSLDDPLCIELSSNGNFLSIQNRKSPRISVESSTGKGLENIATRYRLLAEASINIQDSNDTFTVTIPLLD